MAKMTSHNNMERIFFLILCYLVSVLSFAPLGCYMTTPSDKNDMRQSMAASDMTVLQCVTKCRQDGKAYAGLLVQTNCWCGEEFGRTSAMTDCNFTCPDSNRCGGISSFSEYYVVDETNNSARLMQMNSGGKTFQEARKSCIQNNGDLLGRTIKESSVQENLASKTGIGVTKIWIGLRQRETVYEWVDERDPAQTDTYFKSKSAYENLWNAVDANLKCVAYDVSLKKLGSLDCATSLPFACLYLPLPQGEITTESPSGLLSKDTVSDSLEGKKTLLYIVLPLFLLGYGGACILYCVHKIIRHCCKKGAHAKLPTSSRPLSARKGVVYPIPVMTEPLPAKYPAAPVPPSYSINDAPASARQVQAELTDQERKKALLLENAAKEARERRQKELEQGRLGRIFSGQKKPQDPQMADEDRPESARSTSKLLPVPLASREAPAPPAQQKQPQAAAAPQQSPQQPQTSDPQNMAGMSINEILRNKMAQQANKKKPKKILAA